MDLEAALIADFTDPLTPARRRRKTALSLASFGSPAALRTLAMALAAGTDRRTAAIAERAFAPGAGVVAAEALSEALVETGSPRLTTLAAASVNDLPEPGARALVHFLAGKFDRYDEYDPGGDELRTLHDLAGDRLRILLAERARAGHRVDWALVATREPHRMIDPEWQAAVEVLASAERWPSLWDLLPHATPVHGLRIVTALANAGWQPSGDRARRALAELGPLARECAVDAETGALALAPVVLTQHPAWVTGLAVTADSALLVSGDYDGGVRLWQLPSGTPAGTLDAGPGLWSLAVTPDGSLLATGEHRGPVWLWRLPSREQIGPISGAGFGTASLTVSPDGRLLIGGSSDTKVCVWKLPDGAPAKPLTGHEGGVWSVTVSPDGKLLATGDDHRTVRLWELPAGTPAGTLSSSHGGVVTALVTTPDGKAVISADSGMTARVSPILERPGEVRVLLAESHLWSLAVSPDGGLLAGGEQRGTVRLWHLPGGEPAGVLRGHRGPVRELAITPDGSTLITGGKDGTVRLWPLALLRASRTPATDIDVDRLPPDTPATAFVAALARHARSRTS
ncbi:WD40 repeat domain-containing protein [Amycolatopsis rhabdoformis]|uniref:WD40 repeat domain-containing protein n=1 Tax=Amycolatopsis rhabdoformis TaxID=1448059 RepID=A0ABZ1ICS8_9PSEU|nr:WD40 repeat domain-containing protein [Amycolatopsis rhabdoformis]WSE32264.1 WD40 repeat domain-containing protein [Amycolatopsis rhabdoformis]